MRCVAGKELSTRDIERLIMGFFKGSESLKDQIRNGNIPWTIKQLRTSHVLLAGCGLNDVEKKYLRDLEVMQQCINRLILVSVDPRLKDVIFLQKASALTADILERIDPFKKAIGGLHDHIRE